MRIHHCSYCGQAVYFQNTQCTQCGNALGFEPDSLAMLAFQAGHPAGKPFVPLGTHDNQRYRLCRNASQYQACNWLIPADHGAQLCVACDLNRTIPDLSIPRNLQLWQRLQSEKNRLIYALLRLRLPVISQRQQPGGGLAFDFLDATAPRFQEDSEVMTGHAQGLITIDIAEADDAIREQVRQQMAEPYRTLLGHFRHESAHYYWDRLVRDSHWLGVFRERFGDERADYDQALQQHYRNGPPNGWSDRHVSAYASSHPWEDWAESWAHYLHLVDTLESAWQLGLTLDAKTGRARSEPTDVDFDPYGCPDFDTLIEHWLPLTVALNMLNRSMGQPDAYPFVLSPTVIDKLATVHRIVVGNRTC